MNRHEKFIEEMVVKIKEEARNDWLKAFSKLFWTIVESTNKTDGIDRVPPPPKNTEIYNELKELMPFGAINPYPDRQHVPFAFCGMKVVNRWVRAFELTTLISSLDDNASKMGAFHYYEGFYEHCGALQVLGKIIKKKIGEIPSEYVKYIPCYGGKPNDMVCIWGSTCMDSNCKYFHKNFRFFDIGFHGGEHLETCQKRDCYYVHLKRPNCEHGSDCEIHKIDLQEKTQRCDFAH